MDFSYTDQQSDLKLLVHKILERNCEHLTLQKLEKSESTLHKTLWKDFASSGILGTPFSESLNGSALGLLEACLVVEEIGYYSVCIPFITSVISTGMAVNKFGSTYQKNLLIPKIISGDSILTLALEEPSNEDLKNTQCVVSEKNGIKYISGTKTCVPYGKESDFILIPCKQENKLFLAFVDSKSKGLSIRKLETTTQEPQYLLHLDNVQMNDNLILGSGLQAPDILDWIILRTTTALCSMAVGICRASLELTSLYTSERKAFDRSIASFQAVGHRAANCFIDLSCLKVVTDQAISLLDLEKEAHEQVSIAKIWCGDVTHRISYASQHLHGGIGVDRNYKLFRYCLWAKQLELTLGSSKSHIKALGDLITASN